LKNPPWERRDFFPEKGLSRHAAMFWGTDSPQGNSPTTPLFEKLHNSQEEVSVLEGGGGNRISCLPRRKVWKFSQGTLETTLFWGGFLRRPLTFGGGKKGPAFITKRQTGSEDVKGGCERGPEIKKNKEQLIHGLSDALKRHFND